MMVLTVGESTVKNDHNIVFSIKLHHKHLASFIYISYEDEKTLQSDRLTHLNLILNNWFSSDI